MKLAERGQVFVGKGTNKQYFGYWPAKMRGSPRLKTIIRTRSSVAKRGGYGVVPEFTNFLATVKRIKAEN